MQITQFATPAQLIAHNGLKINRVIGRGWVITRAGVQVDAPQRSKIKATQVAVAYAMGYMN